MRLNELIKLASKLNTVVEEARPNLTPEQEKQLEKGSHTEEELERLNKQTDKQFSGNYVIKSDLKEIDGKSVKVSGFSSMEPDILKGLKDLGISFGEHDGSELDIKSDVSTKSITVQVNPKKIVTPKVSSIVLTHSF